MSSLVGNRIKKLRKEKGLTQEQLGNILGVKKAAVQKWESGAVKNLKQKTIIELSNYFNVSPSIFVNVDNEYLAEQTKLLTNVEVMFGSNAIELIEVYSNLTLEGKSKLLMYARDLLKIYK